jgi:hypothetical protein
MSTKRDRYNNNNEHSTTNRRPRMNTSKDDERVGNAVRRAVVMGWVHPRNVPGLMAVYRSKSPWSRHRLAVHVAHAVDMGRYQAFHEALR